MAVVNHVVMYLFLLASVFGGVFARGLLGWLLAPFVGWLLLVLPSVYLGPALASPLGLLLALEFFNLRCWAQYTRLGHRATRWAYRIMDSLPGGSGSESSTSELPRMPLDRRDGRWFRRPFEPE